MCLELLRKLVLAYVLMYGHSLNGIPGCTHKWLLTDVMRGEFGFRGYIVTDWGALNYAVSYHKYYSSYTEAAAGAANAGVNLELPDNSPAYLHLTEAVQQGLVKMETMLSLVRPLFYTRMRLGEFDPPTLNPYASIDVNVIESDRHRELAVLAATQSFVLLKNQHNTLPFTSKIHRLAVSTTISASIKTFIEPVFFMLLPPSEWCWRHSVLGLSVIHASMIIY